MDNLQKRIQERKKVALIKRMRKKAMEDKENKNDSVAIQTFKEFNASVKQLTKLEFASIILKKKLDKMPEWEELDKAIERQLKEQELPINKCFFTYKKAEIDLHPKTLAAFLFCCKYMFVNNELLITADDISDGTILTKNEAISALEELSDAGYIKKENHNNPSTPIYLSEEVVSESVDLQKDFVMWFTDDSIENMSSLLEIRLLFHMAVLMKQRDNTVSGSYLSFARQLQDNPDGIENAIENLISQKLIVRKNDIIDSKENQYTYMVNPNIACKQVNSQNWLKETFWNLSCGDEMLETLDSMK